jgi:hypothetical protein
MPQTLEEIRRAGLEALRERLGRAGMVRFLQQFSSCEGDYAKTRHDWVDRVSLDDLRTMIKTLKRGKKRRGKRESK